jgi:hypothetical protein
LKFPLLIDTLMDTTQEELKMSDSSATKEEENRITALIHMDQSRSQIVEGGCYHTLAAWTFEFQAGSPPHARRTPLDGLPS